MGDASHVTISQWKRWKRHHYFFFLKRVKGDNYDFILIIHFNASSIKLITLLYTKRAEAKQLRSGELRVNQMYQLANSRSFAIYFTW